MATTRKKPVTKSEEVTPEVFREEPVQRSAPRINIGNFLPKTYTPVLMLLLLVAAFFLGMLTDKVQYLQNGGSYGSGAQQAGTQTAGAQQQPNQPPTKVTVSSGHFPVVGNANAKVTIVEFADFRCPFCEQFFSQTESQLINDYVKTGKAKFYFRQFPFLGPASNVAADAAECANDQGKFWDFHDFLYKNQPPETDTSMYTTDTLTQDAVTLGMDGDKFRQCLDSKADDSKAQSDYTDGQKAGVSGTPSFVINGQLIVGAQPYAQFKTIIDQELAKK